ncbi:MAG TPA: histidine phosphatase family protein [Gemmatimonadota bacterium]|nr:histidine phosphatase family protein [Gemmatimonadota bacterium]
MRRAAFALLAILALPLTAHAQALPSPAGDSVVVFLVRHAEKADDASADPDLTPAGRARAERLARVLSDVGLTAVYSTDYARTRETAGPTAEEAGLGVHLYDPDAPGELAARLRSAPGRYLVVGHGNTVPGLVRALGGRADGELGEAEYDRLYVVLLGRGGATTLALRYGEPSGGGTMGGGGTPR